MFDYSTILDTTVSDINSFLAELNKVYASIADRFPVIEESMKTENKRANSIISYFTDDVNVENSFAYELEQNSRDFSKSFDVIKTFIDKDDVLSDSIVNDVNKTSGIMESINNIRLLADQIKVYSLNAIIISSKHGDTGSAFGEISKNIIKLSDLSNEQADMMNKIGNDLFLHFDDFKTKILKANETQKEGFNEAKRNIVLEHTNIEKSFSIFAEIMLDIMKRVDDSYSFIFDIMMILQREDIIRQQTEHIVETINLMIEENRDFINSYNERLELYKETESEEIRTQLEHLLLDIVTFDDDILMLVVLNLKSIYSEIRDANRSIKMYLTDFEETLNNVSDDRNTILNHMIGSDGFNTTSDIIVSNILFENYASFIDNYTLSYKSFISKKQSISDDNKTINDLIEFLETMFIETKNVSKTFNSINFLAKIELEKNRSMFDSSETFSIDSVEAIASNITTTVEESLVEFNGIKEEIFNSIEKFKENIVEAANEYSNMADMTSEVKVRLENSKNVVRNNVNSFKSYSSELFSILNTTLSELSSLDSLLLSIEEIINVCSDMKSMIATRKNDYYESLGITEWQIETSKYLDILNSYTTQKERAIASGVIGDDVDIDIGADSGEITIF